MCIRLLWVVPAEISERVFGDSSVSSVCMERGDFQDYADLGQGRGATLNLAQLTIGIKRFSLRHPENNENPCLNNLFLIVHSQLEF